MFLIEVKFFAKPYIKIIPPWKFDVYGGHRYCLFSYYNNNTVDSNINISFFSFLIKTSILLLSQENTFFSCDQKTKKYYFS